MIRRRAVKVRVTFLLNDTRESFLVVFSFLWLRFEPRGGFFVKKKKILKSKTAIIDDQVLKFFVANAI